MFREETTMPQPRKNIVSISDTLPPMHFSTEYFVLIHNEYRCYEALNITASKAGEGQWNIR